uniref:Uncharacterized protein n=1 Tax=Rhizophora mucronata TaxID=61149 RepID=A0A2P2LPU6_RHIMU
MRTRSQNQSSGALNISFFFYFF